MSFLLFAYTKYLVGRAVEYTRKVNYPFGIGKSPAYLPAADRLGCYVQKSGKLFLRKLFALPDLTYAIAYHEYFSESLRKRSMYSLNRSSSRTLLNHSQP